VAASPKLVAFAAPSGTGKTTLIERIIAHLESSGLRVGAIKSDAHRVELDTPGKDTHRMRASGAATTALVSTDQIAVFRDSPGPEFRLEDIVALFFADMDIVLAEGFRSHGHPTIVVHRAGTDMRDWEWPANVVAVASDVPFDGVTNLALDDVAAIAAFVLRAHEAPSVPRSSPCPTPSA
jgi:molybdopterin-guanine dinucleotide biosynthesis protein B/molybdopterin-guanine dinucleotide biosynthesis protein